MGVKPGHNTVTWTPWGATSSCSASDREATYALEAWYTAPKGPGAKAAVEETLRSLPERLGTMTPSAARLRIVTASTSRRTISPSSSTGWSTKGPYRPKPASVDHDGRGIALLDPRSNRFETALFLQIRYQDLRLGPVFGSQLLRQSLEALSATGNEHEIDVPRGGQSPGHLLPYPR